MNILTRKTAGIAAGLVLLTGLGYFIGQELPAYGQSTASYCVTYGHGAGAAGNYVEYSWDGSPCPAGTYPHQIGGTTVVTSSPGNFNVNAPDPANDTTWTLTDTVTGQVFTCRYSIDDVASVGDASTPTISCDRTS